MQEEQEAPPISDSLVAEEAPAVLESEITESLDSFFDDEPVEEVTVEEAPADLDEGESGLFDDELPLDDDFDTPGVVEEELNLDDMELDKVAAIADELSRDGVESEDDDLVLEEEPALEEDDPIEEDPVLEDKPALEEDDEFEEDLVLEEEPALAEDDQFEEDLDLEEEPALEDDEFEEDPVLEQEPALEIDDDILLEPAEETVAEEELEEEVALAFADEPEPESEESNEFDEELAAFFDEPADDEKEETVELDADISAEESADEEPEQLLAEDAELLFDEDEQSEELVLELSDEQDADPAAAAPLPVFEEVKEEEKPKKKKKVTEPRVFSLKKLTVSGGLKEAWKYVKGAKFKLLFGALIACLLPAGLNGGVASQFPIIRNSLAITDDLTALYVLAGFLLVGTVIGAALQAGLFYTAVRWVSDRPITLKHIFSGLPKIFSVFFAMLFMFLMTMSGLVLLVLPGIYLAVGYTLTLPLIIDRGMHPWEAMEASRKAIHKVWWQVFGIIIVMSLIMSVSTIPAGLGLIWTIPMYLIVFGVIYRVLFGVKE